MKKNNDTPLYLYVLTAIALAIAAFAALVAEGKIVL